MRSQPLPGEASRRRAEEQFKTTKKVNSETKANTPSRLAEAAKTARLRALRLAKEAADKDTANRGAAAAKTRRPERRRRVRRPQASTPEPKYGSAQSPSRRLRCVAGDIGTVQIGRCW